MRKWIIRVLGLGALSAAAFGAWKAYRARARAVTGGIEWESAPFPFPPVPRPAPAAQSVAPAVAGWVEPSDGACPVSHPVKAKLSSGIFHVPGGMNYERTRPDRCYVDSAAAERDGLRQSKM
jgi:hypothetical protein